MPPVRLTKRIEFAASHRYSRPEWDEAKNREVFGACYNEPGHGHNYLLEVTVAGEVDEHTGMVVNLFTLKQVLLHVLEEFDHKHLNLDTPYFNDQIPTTENIARVLWAKLIDQKEIGLLHGIRLYENEDLFADITGVAGLDVASVTRRYSFTALHEGGDGRSAGVWLGHAGDLFVTVHGPIQQETGMVTDIVVLDRVVSEAVIRSFDGKDVEKVLGTQNVTGDLMVRTMWDRLVTKITEGRLERVRLVHTRDQMFECSR